MRRWLPVLLLAGCRFQGGAAAVGDGASADGAAVDGALVDGSLVDGATVDGALVDGSLIDAATADAAMVDAAMVDAAMADAAIDASIDAAPPDAAIDAPPPPREWEKAITIPAGRVQAALPGFPVWIALADPDLAARASAAGGDLWFSDAAGAAVPYEIQGWDKATGRLLAWARPALLDPNAATTLYLHYGGTGLAPGASPAAVFAGFSAVWHLDDGLATTAVAEARGAYPGTATGLPPTAQVAAKLGGGMAFDGTTSQIAFTNMVSGKNASTFSAWVNEAGGAGHDAIITVGSAMKDKSRFLYARYLGASSRMGYGLYADDVSTAMPPLTVGTWSLVHWTVAADGKSKLYKDGVEISNHDFGSAPNTTGTTAWIGFAPAGWGNAALQGTLDEVRIAPVALTKEWVAAEYANQGSPATFYVVGPELPIP